MAKGVGGLFGSGSGAIIGATAAMALVVAGAIGFTFIRPFGEDAGEGVPTSEATAPDTAPDTASDTAPDTAPAAEPAETAPAPDRDVAATAPDAPDAPAAPPRQPPSFDVVRVDAEGGAVIAGQAQAEATVMVKIDGEPVQVTQADASGAFVALLSLSPSAEPRLLSLEAALTDGVWIPGEETVMIAPIAPADTGRPDGPPAVASASSPPAPAAPETGADAGFDIAAADGLPAPQTEASPPVRMPAPAPEEAPATTPPPAAPVEPPSAEANTASSEPSAPEGTDPPPTGDASATRGTDAPSGEAGRGSPVTPDAPNAIAAAPRSPAEADAAPPPVGAPAASTAPPPTSTAPPATPRAPAVLLADGDGVRVLQSSGPPPVAQSEVRLDAITYDTEGDVTLAGRGPAAADLRVTLDGSLLQRLEIGPGGDWRLDLPNVDPGTYTLALEQLAPDGSVSARIETPFLREDPARIAANPMLVAPGASVITVQPGFTLWGIAEANFGEGLLYVQIFEDNRDAIRDPDLIFPGQIFDLPDLPRVVEDEAE
jgi:nucleoid-associated protein YgaU